MTLHVNDGGTWKSAIPHVNDAGVWKAVKEIWVNDGGTWKQAFINIVITLTPSSQSASGSTAARTFSAVTVSVTGGTATAYNWGFSDTGGFNWTIASGQGTASAAPRINLTAGGDVATASFWCDVTVGGSVYRATCPLSYSNNGSGV